MTGDGPSEVRRGETGAHTYLGLSSSILAGAHHTGHRFSVVELTIEPGAGMPRHDHPDVVFGWYGLAGTLTVETDDGPIELSARDFLLDPPGFAHAVANRKEQPARVLLVCAPPGCEQFFVAAAEAIASDVVQAPLTDDTRNALAELAGRHGWQLDPDAETRW